jgi:hypothetical protein
VANGRAAITSRRFPPPWSIEEIDECFIVRDADGQALGYFYFDEEQQSPTIDRRLTRDDARRIAADTDVANNETHALQPLWH